MGIGKSHTGKYGQLDFIFSWTAVDNGISAARSKQSILMTTSVQTSNIRSLSRQTWINVASKPDAISPSSSQIIEADAHHRAFKISALRLMVGFLIGIVFKFTSTTIRAKVDISHH
jgi:hypothetical protein